VAQPNVSTCGAIQDTVACMDRKKNTMTGQLCCEGPLLMEINSGTSTASTINVLPSTKETRFMFGAIACRTLWHSQVSFSPISRSKYSMLERELQIFPEMNSINLSGVNPTWKVIFLKKKEQNKTFLKNLFVRLFGLPQRM
jgi:hypothetical protein